MTTEVRSPQAEAPRPEGFPFWGLCAICLGVVVWLLVSGCATTVVPSPVRDGQASWDGNAQTSGLLGFDAAGNGILTGHARDRYNALVAVYGGAFSPPVQPDDGITRRDAATFLLDAEHLVKFATMNRWRKSGKPAP